MFQLLRDAIPMMKLLRKINRNGFSTLSTTLEVHCREFEDNSGALELALTPKIRPCTKNINQVYYHFRDFVRNGTIQIFAIESVNQASDIFTKPLTQNDFLLYSFIFAMLIRKSIYAIPGMEILRK